MSEEDTDTDASYLPDIPHVFQRGSLYAPLPAQSSDAPSQPGHSELYLPTIEGVFEQGIPSKSFLNRQYSPRIEGYFEEGLASESVPRTQLSVADQYLPEIEGLFESGYLSDSLSRSLPHSEEGIASQSGPHRDISQLFQSGSSSGNIEPVTSESPSQLSSSLNLSSVWSSPSRRAPDFLQSPNFDPFAVSTLFESQLFSDISSSFAPQTTQQSTPLSSRFGLWSPSDSGIQAPDSSFWADNLFRTQEATSEPTGIVAQLTDEIRYQNSSNFVEDLELMAQKGFIIDAQPIGTISKGHFGNAITGQVDISGQTFTFADVGQPFFVKMVECKVGDQMSDMKREMFDIESMGQRTQGRYKNNPSISFPSAERQYMILELAELGDLESFLENNQVSEELCLILIRDMYFGLKHLHDWHVFHCDIEPRNVLLFQRQGQVVVKWCDFGMAVIMNGSHPSQASPLLTDRISEYRRYDLECLTRVFQMVLMYSQTSGQMAQHIEQIIEQLSAIDDLGSIRDMFNF